MRYHELIPAIEFEVLPAGEGGPRRLDASKVMDMHGVPFLNVTEFLRAKTKTWIRCACVCRLGCGLLCFAFFF